MRKRLSPIHTRPFDLTDEQWQIVAPLLPTWDKDLPGRMAVPARRFPLLGGRPPAPDRPVLNGILWKLRAGTPWYSLPDTYPSYQTCRRRYYTWVQAGAMPRILRSLASHLARHAGIDLFACLDMQTLRVTDRNALIGLLFSPGIQETWQISTLLLFLSPLKENSG